MGDRIAAVGLNAFVEGLVSRPAAPDEVYFHGDLAERDDDALVSELRRLRFAKALSPNLDWWVLERLGAIEAVISSRRARRAHPVNGGPRG